MNLWFKIFFRNAKKNWLNILINILGLTLGLTGLIIVLLYINDEESYNKWNPNKDTIYRVSHRLDKETIYQVGPDIEGKIFQNEIPEVTEHLIALPWYSEILIKINGTSTYIDKTVLTEKNFFDFFPFEIVNGSVNKFGESKTNIAISKKLATQLFGNDNAIGKSITYNKTAYLVTVVYKINPKSFYAPELIQQYAMLNKGWNNFNNAVFVKTNKNTDIKKLQEKMAAVLIKHTIEPDAKNEGISINEYIDKNGKITPVPEPLSKIRLHSLTNDGGPEGSGSYKMLLVLLGISILLILISCVNFINLSIASASQRAKEVGIKKNLGLSKSQLIVQYTSEIIVQSIVALSMALLLVELLLPSFNDFTDKELILLNIPFLLKITTITLVLAIIVGVIPASYLSKYKTTEVLKGNISRSKKGVFVRNVMLAVQLLISGLFIIGVFVINAQISFMLQKDLGFSGKQIIAIDIKSKNKLQKYQLIKQVLGKNTNIESISSCENIPGFGSSSATTITYKDDKSIQVLSNPIDYNYLSFAKIKVLKGREFSSKFAMDTVNNIIINKTAAKQLGIFNDPIGKKITIGWESDNPDQEFFHIVGVIDDYNMKGLESKIEPLFMIHYNTFDYTEEFLSTIQLKVKPNDIANTIAEIENFWKKNIDVGFPFEYKFVDKEFEKSFDKYKKQQTLFYILSLTVILIALLGLFALATLTIQQRFKEVAIRKTLGASEKEIVLQLIKSFLKVTVITSIVIIPLAFFLMQKWLDNFAYRIDMPIWPYIVTPLILLFLVFSVVSIKAYNATKVDLIKYLKFE